MISEPLLDNSCSHFPIRNGLKVSESCVPLSSIEMFVHILHSRSMFKCTFRPNNQQFSLYHLFKPFVPRVLQLAY
jgi:hypothetical protein